MPDLNLSRLNRICACGAEIHPCYPSLCEDCLAERYQKWCCASAFSIHSHLEQMPTRSLPRDENDLDSLDYSYRISTRAEQLKRYQK